MKFSAPNFVAVICGTLTLALLSAPVMAVTKVAQTVGQQTGEGAGGAHAQFIFVPIMLLYAAYAGLIAAIGLAAVVKLYLQGKLRPL